jgi:hypothetical protein
MNEPRPRQHHSDTPTNVRFPKITPTTNSPRTVGWQIRVARSPPSFAAIRIIASDKTTEATGSPCPAPSLAKTGAATSKNAPAMIHFILILMTSVQP